MTCPTFELFQERFGGNDAEFEPNLSLIPFFKPYDFSFISATQITHETFKEKTKGIPLLKYVNFQTEFQKFNIETICEVMVIRNCHAFLYVSYLFKKLNPPSLIQTNTTNENDNQESNDEGVSDGSDSNYQEEDDQEPNKRKRYGTRNDIESTKKAKLNIKPTNNNSRATIVNNLLSEKLLQERDFNLVSKVKLSYKVELFFTVNIQSKNQFLKIVHYYDNSYENEKGMKIVKSITHDNISKIKLHERRLITWSQMRELFDELNPSIYKENVIYITLSDLVVSVSEFCFFKLFSSHNACFAKIMIDGIEAVNTLHENNIIHGNISIENVGFTSNRPNHSKYVKEKSEFLKHIPINVNNHSNFNQFNFVLVDLNHCKVEGQEIIKTMRIERNWPYEDDTFYGRTLIPYCPSEKSLRFTKQHDRYSMSLLLAQLYLIIIHDVPYYQIINWITSNHNDNGNHKTIILNQLDSKQNDNSITIINKLKQSIENDGETDLFNLQQTIQLLKQQI